MIDLIDSNMTRLAVPNPSPVSQLLALFLSFSHVVVRCVLVLSGDRGGGGGWFNLKEIDSHKGL